MPKKKKEKPVKEEKKEIKTEKKKEKEEILPVILPTIVEEDAEKKKPKKKLSGLFTGEHILVEDCEEARELYNQSRYGHMGEDGRLQVSLLEALYLLEKGKLDILEKKDPLDFPKFLARAKKAEPNFYIRYSVFKDIRNRGYIIKTALKFGADFRVYDRGVKPGEDHARWIVYPVHEGSTMTWYEFSAKNRVAHSTKKRLLIGVVDDEGDVTYWEIRWMRP
jgi:tRNA-intron endonuclease, archaea type